AAANAVAMTEDAKRKLRQLDTETDAVWAERGRLIEDVRNVATSLFSLAEDAAERFPEDGERGGATVAAAMPASAPESSAPESAASAPASAASVPAPVIAPEPGKAPAPASPVSASAPTPVPAPAGEPASDRRPN